MDIETSNDQFVGVSGLATIVVSNPKRTMTKAAALRHAAWLVALAEEEPGEFQAVLDAVRNT